MAYAKRGFAVVLVGFGELSFVFGLIRVVEFENNGLLVFIDQIIFVEDGLGHHVFFRRPVAKVPHAATLAAEREVGVFFGVRGVFTNRAAMFHRNGLYWS